MAKTQKYDDYEPVAERLAKFHADHPRGEVHTELTEERVTVDKNIDGTIIELEGNVRAWTVKAVLYDEKGKFLASGHARQELLKAPPKTQSGRDNIFAPEWTSPVEVCETSAIGRALANAGYAAKRPSREEMATTKRNQLDPHERAWQSVWDVLGPDDAEHYFKAALESLGLVPGEDRLSEEQATVVIENLP